MTEVDNSSKRRKIAPAETPQQAIQRQNTMAASDCQAMYDFTISAFPIAYVAPALNKAIGVRDRFPASSIDDREKRAIIQQITSAVTLMNRAIARSAEMSRTGQAKMQDILTKRRLCVFRADFCARKRFKTEQGTCSLCDKATAVTTFDCCKTLDATKTLCIDCLEKNAFYSSKHGTSLNACCPFCRAEYPVYVERVLKRKRTQ